MNQYVIEQIKKNKEYLQKEYNIKRIGIFGSYARGEESPDSDIDILVEFSRVPDLFKYVAAEMYLESILHKKIDLVEKNSIRAELKNNILQEVQDI